MSVLLLLIFLPKSLERVDIEHFVDNVSKVFDNVRGQGLDVLAADVLKEFADGRVHHVVPSIVFHQGVDHWRKEIALDYVSVVKLVFQADDFPHEP